MPKRKSIALTDDQHETLATLYVAKGIPVDRYETRPSHLRNLTENFNNLTERSDTPEEIFRYMRTRRKDSKGRLRWPRLGKDILRDDDYVPDTVPLEHIATLIDTYVSIGRAHGKGNDSFSYDPELKRELAETFRAKTGVAASAEVLLAILRDLRKAGLLERLELPDTPPPGFGDLDEAAGM